MLLDTVELLGPCLLYTAEPHLATVEWGQEMLRTFADYMADFLTELEKLDLPKAEI